MATIAWLQLHKTCLKTEKLSYHVLFIILYILLHATIKQGCALSCTLLFKIFLEMIMALDGSNEGAEIRGEEIGDLRFADDIALLAEQEKGLQKETGVTQVSQKMGMKINIKKTECLFLGDGNKKFPREVEGEEMEQIENFVYLGVCTSSTQEGSDKDVERRIGLARFPLPGAGEGMELQGTEQGHKT